MSLIEEKQVNKTQQNTDHNKAVITQIVEKKTCNKIKQ